jgi:hypothetical protein
VPNERVITETSQRLRALLLCQPGVSAARLAERLDVPAESLQRLLEPRPGAMINTEFLIDLLAAVVHEYGCDSSWLLTGTYREATHRQLEEDGPLPLRSVRAIVVDQLATAP